MKDPPCKAGFLLYTLPGHRFFRLKNFPFYAPNNILKINYMIK